MKIFCHVGNHVRPRGYAVTPNPKIPSNALIFQEEECVNNFELTNDPRPPGFQKSCWPAWWFIPSQRARANGGACFKYFGAGILRAQLKKLSCCPRPIHGTQRNTQERERALILTIPLMIKYETGHLWGGTIHSTNMTVLVNLFGDNIDNDNEVVNSIVWGAQFILIYSGHVLPCLVQRLNRAQLYAAIEEFRCTPTAAAAATTTVAATATTPESCNC